MANNFPFWCGVIENFLDCEDEYEMEKFKILASFGIIILHKSSTVSPRMIGYAENVVPLFTTANFRYHFRISKEMFEEILTVIGGQLSSKHGGGSEEIQPSKQLLIFLCYMANKETMREIGHYFGIGLSTVHGVLQRVNTAIKRKSNIICVYI
jgi:hypothetical protein